MTLRRFALITTLAVVLALPAVAGAGTIDRGVVQAVEPSQITLRALDGTVTSFAVGPATRVKLNGVLVTLTDVKPGFIAAVVHNGNAPATAVRAFGKPVVLTDRGVVVGLSKTTITISTAAGKTLTVPLDGNTRFTFHGLPARRMLARPGADVAVRHADGAAAKVVNVLKRARA